MDLVDTDRYPIDLPESAAAQALVKRCRQQFIEHGVVTLPGFLRDQAVRTIATEIEPHVGDAFFCRSTHNVFLDDGEPDLGIEHPRNRQMQTGVGSIANDYVPADGALQRLYDWPCLTKFVGAVLGHETFYRGADPLGALSVNVYGDGDGHGWHFDESAFSVTLSVQQPADGGHFEYVSGLRTDSAVAHDRIEAVLDGADANIERLDFAAGTLSIFGGRHTMHRVTPASGPIPRLVPVLTYDVVPGSTNSDAVRELFWGRTS